MLPWSRWHTSEQTSYYVVYMWLVYNGQTMAICVLRGGFARRCNNIEILLKSGRWKASWWLQRRQCQRNRIFRTHDINIVIINTLSLSLSLFIVVGHCCWCQNRTVCWESGLSPWNVDIWSPRIYNTIHVFIEIFLTCCNVIKLMAALEVYVVWKRCTSEAKFGPNQIN